MKSSNTKSFTILETLIAVTLIIILVTAFFGSLLSAFNYLRRIIELRTVNLILQEEVSKVRNLEFSDIQSLGPSFSSSGMSSLDNATGTITKSLYNGEDNIIKITFGTNWTTFDGNPGHQTMTTLMTDHGINKK